MELASATDPVCYVQCNFCNTILAVSVPSSSMLMAIVTVRCGHCANLLSLNMPQSNPLHQFPLQDLQKFEKQHLEGDQETVNNIKDHLLSGSSSSSSPKFDSPEHERPRPPPIRPPEKRHRVPSAYNRFIKEEIQRIKAGNPKISHREAFSTAAKNWAHFPHIHFGLKMDGNNNNKNKQAKITLEKPFSAESTQKHLMVSTDPWIN